uniref:Putative secreted peptide n=1 Tax=Anopheles braziliensis TaxID=58242 RepID=A0A2M3ZMZ4_9DIPT
MVYVLSTAPHYRHRLLLLLLLLLVSIGHRPYCHEIGAVSPARARDRRHCRRPVDRANGTHRHRRSTATAPPADRGKRWPARVSLLGTVASRCSPSPLIPTDY